MSETFRDLEVDVVMELENSPCDVFIFMPSGKKITLCEKDNLVNKKQIQKYSEKKEVKLKIREEDYPALLKTRLEIKARKIKINLEDTQFMNRAKRLNIELTSFALARAMVSLMGVPESVMELADDALSSVSYTIEKVPSLKTILADINTRGDYFVQKSLIMNYICFYVISKTPYNADHLRKNLSLACLLHDFTLKDNFHLTHKDLSPAEIEDRTRHKMFLEHSEKEAEILSKFNLIPMDVINMIRFHHVDLDGTGFPLKQVSNLSYLSQVFNVSHNLSIELLEHGYCKKNISGYFYDLSNRILDRYKPILDPFSYII